MPAHPVPAVSRARRLCAVLAALVTASLAGPREAAATFPRLVSARALSPGAAEVGLAAALGNTDPDYLAGWASLRRGLFRGVDAGVRLGAVQQDRTTDDPTGPLFGADGKVQVLRESIDIPIDFAVDIGWTVALLSGDTYSDLSVAGLFGKTFRGVPVLGEVIVTAGAELVFLGGTARPGADETAAYGLASVDLRLGGRFVFTPELKAGSDVVYGVALKYRF